MAGRDAGGVAWVSPSICVEANLEATQEVLGNASIPEALPISLAGIKRRLDSMLPPWTAQLYVDIQMQPVSDLFCWMYWAVHTLLIRTYRGAWTSTWAVEGTRSMRPLGLRNCFPHATGCGRRPEPNCAHPQQFNSMVNGRVQSALAELDVTRRSLERRGSVILEEGGGTASGLEVDILVNAAVAAGITSPTVRLDSIGLIIVVDGPPRDDD